MGSRVLLGGGPSGRCLEVIPVRSPFNRWDLEVLPGLTGGVQTPPGSTEDPGIPWKNISFYNYFKVGQFLISLTLSRVFTVIYNYNKVFEM